MAADVGRNERRRISTLDSLRMAHAASPSRASEPTAAHTPAFRRNSSTKRGSVSESRREGALHFTRYGPLRSEGADGAGPRTSRSTPTRLSRTWALGSPSSSSSSRSPPSACECQFKWGSLILHDLTGTDRIVDAFVDALEKGLSAEGQEVVSPTSPWITSDISDPSSP